MLESIFGSSTGASQEEMAKAQLPIGWRDNCAGLLIPLNRVYRALYYLMYSSH